MRGQCTSYMMDVWWVKNQESKAMEISFEKRVVNST